MNNIIMDSDSARTTSLIMIMKRRGYYEIVAPEIIERSTSSSDRAQTVQQTTNPQHPDLINQNKPIFKKNCRSFLGHSLLFC